MSIDDSTWSVLQKIIQLNSPFWFMTTGNGLCRCFVSFVVLVNQAVYQASFFIWISILLVWSTITGQAWSWKDWEVGLAQCIWWWSEAISAKSMLPSSFASSPIFHFACFTCFFFWKCSHQASCIKEYLWHFIFSWTVVESVFIFFFSTYYTGKRNNSVMELDTGGLMVWRIMQMNMYGIFEIWTQLYWLNSFVIQSLPNCFWLFVKAIVQETQGPTFLCWLWLIFHIFVCDWPGYRCYVVEC